MEGAVAVAGSCMCFLVLGTIFIWGNVAIYITSYLRQYDSSITLADTFIVLPIIVIAKAPVNYLGARLCVHYGTRM